MGAWPWLVAGCLLPATFPALPPPWLAVLSCLLALPACAHARWRGPGLALLALALGLHAWQGRLAGRFPGAQEPPEVMVTGKVLGLPERVGERLQFRFLADRVAGFRDGPVLLLVRGYRDVPAVAGGERWALRLRLASPRGRVNFAGSDAERWHFAEGIQALAQLRGGAHQRLAGPAGIDGWRARSHARLETLLAGRPGSGLVLALAVAARGALAPADRDALRRTGTAHLLAISGLHVGLVAMFAGLALRWPVGLLLAGLGARRPGQAMAWSALAAATAYATLAGFETSTRRAVLMLAVPLACRLLGRELAPATLLLAAAGVVLLLDPFAGLDPGFWLSFLAVAALLVMFVPRRPAASGLRALLRAQWAVGIGLLPLSAALFGFAGPGGLLVNIAAIPWVSLVTLPLSLLGLLLAAPAPVAAEWLLDLAARSADWALRGIAFCDALLAGTLRELPPPSWPALLVAFVGAVVLLLPRGLSWRWAGSLLLLPLLAPAVPRPPAGAVELELLDVGQGQAALLRTREHALLYDAGPGLPGDWDLVAGVLAPALRANGVRSPDRVLVSHADLDHAGGLDALQARYPAAEFHGALPRPRPGVGACDENLGWDWDGVDFQVLHPSGHLPYSGNDSSCVLVAATEGASLLLPGDIGRHVERRLAHLASRGHAVVIAPHHGSRSSSSPEWLAWARPQVALVSAGAGNRFGFPHVEVLDRLHAAGSTTWSTADCGALRVRLGADGSIQATSARRQRPAPWRWPAAAGCP